MEILISYFIRGQIETYKEKKKTHKLDLPQNVYFCVVKQHALGVKMGLNPFTINVEVP